MFGYVRPSDRRLSEQEREAFRAAYCGLCHALGKRYGLAGRMILNYDLTFLAMVLSDGAGRTECRRCAIHPVKGCPCAEGDPALNTAADMSVILTYWQLRDGVADHGFWGGLKYRVASALLGVPQGAAGTAVVRPGRAAAAGRAVRTGKEKLSDAG